jgi:ribonuclease Z
VTEAEPGVVWERDGVRVTMFAVDHAPVAPAVGYRVDFGGKSVVVSGDTRRSETLVEMARGADLLVHEAVDVPSAEAAEQVGLGVSPQELAREARLHGSVEAAGRLAQRAGVTTLALVRLRPPPVYAIQLTSRVDDHFAGRILVPDDGDEVRP